MDGGILLPKGACLAWDWWMVWGQAGADALSILAYLITAGVFFWIAKYRPIVKNNRSLSLCARAVGFFLLSGAAISTTNILSLWYPYYALQTGTKGIGVMILAICAVILKMRLSRGMEELEIAEAEDARQIKALLLQAREHADAFTRQRQTLSMDIAGLETLLQKHGKTPGSLSIELLVEGLQEVIADLKKHIAEA